ncbi:MAG TPA: 3-phosphoshikimate 1-carboxyvinyltransferase [Actinomycetota bacterium]
MSMGRSIIITPCRHVEGEVRVPGDKSISHRALLVGMLAEAPLAVSGLSPAQDVAATRQAVEALGSLVSSPRAPDGYRANVEIEPSQVSISDRDLQIQVAGPGWDRLSSPGDPIDIVNSGTTIRLLLGILAGSTAEATLTGDPSIRRRPMARVVDPLRLMGAKIDGADGGERAPLTVHGTALLGRDHVLPMASAQVKSALIFAGLRATGITSIAEPAPSRDHTERMLAHLGVPIEKSQDRLILKSTNIQGGSVMIPGDLSSAAFLLVAAAILPGSQLSVADVGLNPTRSGILDILSRYGADVHIEDKRVVSGEPVGTLTVRAADRLPLRVDGELAVRALDELPLVGVLGAFAEGETVVADAAELRVKESDRIAALAAGLGAMGVDITSTPDGFTIRGSARPAGASLHGAGDHRIAMALAIAALGADGPSQISGWEAVGVSYPGFEDDLASVVVP